MDWLKELSEAFVSQKDLIKALARWALKQEGLKKEQFYKYEVYLKIEDNGIDFFDPKLLEVTHGDLQSKTDIESKA